MKYRHQHHAGNFADVHKHLSLLCLIAALQQKEKGFLYLETHAGSGLYASSDSSAEGIRQFLNAELAHPLLRQYADAVAAIGKHYGQPTAYPGSPLFAAHLLRPQDRAVFVELQQDEARKLQRLIDPKTKIKVHSGDGYQTLNAVLPPTERRGLIFIDPPYEETQQEYSRAAQALSLIQNKFATAVVALWYPIKAQRDLARWHNQLTLQTQKPHVYAELWLHPKDSRVALNGSGLFIMNPPFDCLNQMPQWLTELHAVLDRQHTGGWEIRRHLQTDRV